MKPNEYAQRVLMVLVFLSCGTVIHAQTTQPASKPDRGISPTGSYAISDMENVSLTNGNVNLSIPLASLPPIAGGKLSWSLHAIYNSKLWDMKSFQEVPDSFHSQSWTHRAAQRSESGGWIVSGKYEMFHFLASADVQVTCPPGDQQCIAAAAYNHKMMLRTPDGAKHELRPIDYPAYPGVGNQSWRRGFYAHTPDSTGVPIRYYSYDGSFLWAVINPSTSYEQWRVLMPDGTSIVQYADVQQLKDTNGNIIEIRSTTDQAGLITTSFKDLRTGRDLKFVYNPAGAGSGQVQYNRVGEAPGVNVVNVNINFAQTSLQNIIVNAGDRFCLQWGVPLTTAFTTISSIVLPQTEVGITRQLSFAYNSSTIDTLAVPIQYKTSCGGSLQTVNTASHGIGELSSVTLPSGAIVQYDYEMDGTQDLFQEPFGAQEVPKNRIKQKRLIHDGVTDAWNYSITNVSAEVSCQSDGQKTKQEFFSHDPGNAAYMGGSTGLAGLVYRTTRMRASDDVKLSKVETQWEFKMFTGANNESADGFFVGFNPVVKAEYTTLYDESGNASKMSARKYEHDYNGNVISVSEYGFLVGSVPVDPITQVPTDVPPGSVAVRTTTTSYYNGASDDGPNVYAKRALATATPLILSAPRETIVGPSKTQFSYDNLQFDVAPTTSGNLTKESHWDGTKFLDTGYGYDTYGNRTTVTDPKGNVTTIAFDTATHAQPISVMVDPDPAPGHTGDELTTTTEYDFSTGLVLRQTDPNGAITETDYTNQRMKDAGQPTFDPYGRPGVVIGPPVTSTPVFGQQYVGHKRKTVTRYRDNDKQVEVSSDLNSQDDGLLKSRTSSDSLGRVTLTETSENGTTNYTISSQSVYEQMGRITYASNPMKSAMSPTDGWTRTTRDELGRVIELATFDGKTKPTAVATNWNGHILTTYAAEQTTVTDQAGIQRKSVVNGLGRLVSIYEDPGGLNYQTTYAYDALGNLTQVNQGTGTEIQVRLFTYDALSRLLTAKNPEQVDGNNPPAMVATSYSYDDASNLSTRTNPNSTTVGFDYDGLNRVTKKTLSVGGTFTYVYDTAINGKGRLKSVTSSDGDGCVYDSYDLAGRVIANHQLTTAGNQQRSYAMGYGYNLAGEMTKEVYPYNNKEVWTSYDSAARLTQVSRYVGQALDKTYASAVTYTPHGAVESMSLAGGKMTQQNTYNGRLQPKQMDLKNVATNQILLGLDYGYDTTTNNGNMKTQTIRIGGTTQSNPTTSFNQTFTYDALNRLDTATETNGWMQDYDYDRFGNRWVMQSTGGITPDPSLCPRTQNDISKVTNRIVMAGFSYDFSGNQKTQTRSGQSESYDYDSENRLLKVTAQPQGVEIGSYVYDGNGRRVKKTDPTTGTTVFVYNASGQLLAEYTSAPAQPNGTSYLTTDDLGSTRLVIGIDPSGNVVVKARHDYLPFGEEIPSTVGRGSVLGYGSTDSTRQRFTSKQRDIESGLDYFEARYFSSAQGRFTSPDEFTGGPDDLFDFADAATDNPTFYADLTDPQSLNKYQYCYNNPLAYVDVDGHDGTKKWIKETLNGALAAYVEDNGLGFLLGERGEETETGHAIGHGLAMVQAATELSTGIVAALGGGAEGVATSPLLVTPAAAVPATGLAIGVGGVALAAHGGFVAGNTISNVLEKRSTPSKKQGDKFGSGNDYYHDDAIRPKQGSSGGAGQNKAFSDKTKIAARAESNNRCVFCTKRTTQTPGPRRSEIDHAIPKARGGNNSSLNAQNTCRTCNRTKSKKTTAEFLKLKQ